MRDDRRTDKARQARQQNARPTIGFLDVGLWSEAWLGVADAARKRDANMFCFVGGRLRSPDGFEAQGNVLYDLVSEEIVDGLGAWTGFVGAFVDREELESFLDHYRPLPLTIFEQTHASIPHVLMDDYAAMCEMMIHLIEVHGYRRIAFIRGPATHGGAQERYRAYTETLVEYGLPVDPNLVTPPIDGWEVGEGTAMIKLLLDDRKLRPQVDFEAVVGVSDLIVAGALAALQVRGIRVPDDVAVVGFDDASEARTATPPLTTVRAPFYEAGQQSIEMVLAQLQGEQLPKRVTVSAELIVRRSCGCLGTAVAQAGAGSVAVVGESLEATLAARREDILSRMVQAVARRYNRATSEVAALSAMVTERAEQLMDSFAAEIADGAKGAYLSALDEVLRHVVTEGGDVASWNGAVSTLRRQVLPHLDRDRLSVAEDLWQQARVMIGDAVQHAEVIRSFQAEQQAQALRETVEALAIAPDMAELMDALTQGLPRLGIPSCYLSLYEDPQPYRYPQAAPEWSRLMLVYDENGRVELPPGGRRFPTRQLVPDGLLPQDRQYGMIVEPLYFREDQLGFALFEIGPRKGESYNALRGHISSALKGVLLLQERQRAEEALQKAYAEVEKQVEERTAELQREIAERKRIEKERERLQQEIIETQKQAIQELSTPVIPVMERIIVMPLIGNIDTMRARDITRALLAGIREHQAKVVILDITGVPFVDSGVAAYLDKTIQAARLKGARTIVTGISEVVAETIVDLGIDWSGIETLRDLQTGLRAAMAGMGRRAAR